MKEHPALIAAAAAHAGDRRGTPAGNAPLTQEQYAVLRLHNLLMEHLTLHPVLVPARPPCPGDIPNEHRAQAQMVMMPAVVMGEKIVAPRIVQPILLLPDGTMGVPSA